MAFWVLFGVFFVHYVGFDLEFCLGYGLDFSAFASGSACFPYLRMHFSLFEFSQPNENVIPSQVIP